MALPTLNGSIGYIFSSRLLSLPNSGGVPFEDIIERFKVYDPPHVPEARDKAGSHVKGLTAPRYNT